MRKRSFLLVTGACVATLSLAVGNGKGSFPGIQIGGVNQIASYDAVGTSPIQAKASGCSINRPANSGQGVDALVASRTANNHCLQFARSSSNDSGGRSGSHLTYIPFGTDAVAYAVLQTGSVSRNLDVPTLKAIYTCDSNVINPANFKPLLP